VASAREDPKRRYASSSAAAKAAVASQPGTQLSFRFCIGLSVSKPPLRLSGIANSPRHAQLLVRRRPLFILPSDQSRSGPPSPGFGAQVPALQSVRITHNREDFSVDRKEREKRPLPADPRRWTQMKNSYSVSALIVFCGQVRIRLRLCRAVLLVAK